MSTFKKIAEIDDIPVGEGRTYEVEDKQIALFHLQDQFYAIDNLCQHAGGPLAEGQVEDCIVTCPWHAWTYDVRTGECLTNPNIKQVHYPIKVDGKNVLIAV